MINRKCLYLFLCISASTSVTTTVSAFAVLNARTAPSTVILSMNQNNDNDGNNNMMIPTDIKKKQQQLLLSTRRDTMFQLTTGLGAVALTLGFNPLVAEARLESVNNPKLLPTEKGLNVIQTEKFLTSGQVKRLDTLLALLERDTGYRVRVLCQAYPNTPGLAIRDYWDLGYDGQKDDKYVVLVVDQFGGKGNVLNFNVGDGLKLILPNIFWTRLQAKYGTTFYVRDNGIDLSITNAIEAIVTCLRSEDQFCINVPDATPSLRSLGFS